MTILTYDLTRDQLEKARATLATNNINLIGDSGIFIVDKIEFTFSFVEPKLTISFKASMFVTGYVKSKINSWFKTEVNDG